MKISGRAGISRGNGRDARSCQNSHGATSFSKIAFDEADAAHVFVLNFHFPTVP